MPVIKRIESISSIQPGPNSKILPNGTIVDPIPWEGAEIEFDDGIVATVERPLSKPKLLTAHAAAKAARKGIDGLKPGDAV